jgi:hypothetical protein
VEKLDELAWLMRWYRSRCDGEWEHDHGIEIGTLDNPGWSLKIDLRGTPLEGRAFTHVSFNVDEVASRPDASWYDCRVVDSAYEGYGGALDLPVLVRIFREWAE